MQICPLHSVCTRACSPRLWSLKEPTSSTSSSSDPPSVTRLSVRSSFSPVRQLLTSFAGCYAQTELGHGSNVQGLETTATYDASTQSFTLQSPGLSSAKWWIGGLGRSADHAVVMAQLYTPDGKNGKLINRGPHAFFVPIRDVKTREPLPGRTIMDIGPSSSLCLSQLRSKLTSLAEAGYPMTDNGTMLLDQVEIPHVNFLARYAKIDPTTGKYEKPPNAKLSYGTMYVSQTQKQVSDRTQADDRAFAGPTSAPTLCRTLAWSSLAPPPSPFACVSHSSFL